MADNAWEPCEVCLSRERKPYLMIARGGVYVPLSDRQDHGIRFLRAAGSSCDICGHCDDDEREPPVYLCFECVPQWLELTAMSIPNRAKEEEAT